MSLRCATGLPTPRYARNPMPTSQRGRDHLSGRGGALLPSKSEARDDHHCLFRPALQGQANSHRRPIKKGESERLKRDSELKPLDVNVGRHATLAQLVASFHGKPNACIARSKTFCCIWWSNCTQSSATRLSCIELRAALGALEAEVNPTQRPINLRKTQWS